MGAEGNAGEHACEGGPRRGRRDGARGRREEVAAPAAVARGRTKRPFTFNSCLLTSWLTFLPPLFPRPAPGSSAPFGPGPGPVRGLPSKVVRHYHAGEPQRLLLVADRLLVLHVLDGPALVAALFTDSQPGEGRRRGAGGDGAEDPAEPQTEEQQEAACSLRWGAGRWQLVQMTARSLAAPRVRCGRGAQASAGPNAGAEAGPDTTGELPCGHPRRLSSV